ncbi:MAG: hypothetical protein K2H40_08870 [Lachnospiraceae bacterium]|nr:hypothetical protein [Lachnospiraceae bacterium]
MELKYYLRGLGLGIVITAIIMGIVSSRSEAMTDEEIIARAKQLGMIEDRVLSEAASDDDETSGDNSGADENAAQNSTKEDGSVQTDSAPDESTLPDDNALPDENDPSDEPEGMSAANDASMTTLPDDEETGQEASQAEQNVSDIQETAEAQEASADNEEAAR